MTTHDTGARAPSHAPLIERAAFLLISLPEDPDLTHEAVCGILRVQDDPYAALAECSDIIGGFGVESLSLATGEMLLYVNKGDTYDSTLCHIDGGNYFVSSWGHVYENADREHGQASGQRRCCFCSEWTEPRESCGSCGRDPETGGRWPETLRHVELETGHSLRTWDTGRADRQGRTGIGYELLDADGVRIFRGEDFRCSPLHADESDASLRALLGFLTLRPGDTDSDYFDDYNDAQRAFCDSSECETLAWLYSDDGSGLFADLEDGRDE